MKFLDYGPTDDLTLYGPNSVMFRSVRINKTALLQKIQPKSPTYHLKAQVKFNATTSDGVVGHIYIVRK